jgi:membrane-associated phospholipid phosphatase
VNLRQNVAKPGYSIVDRQVSDREYSASRREFLKRIPGAAAVTVASSAIPFGSSTQAGGDQDNGSDGKDRVRDSYDIRVEAARDETKVPVPKQVPNGDEKRYSNYIGNYSKGLPHDSIGEVDLKAYSMFLSAVHQGTAAAFEQVPLGGAGPDQVKLVNPLAGLAFDLEGTDSHQLMIPPIPSVASKELADQAVELYWQALCRDVNFTDYATDSRAIAAAAELSKLTKFKGPTNKGFVTAQTLFRGFTAGDVIGPYVSQLMLKPFNYGPYAMTGQISTYVPGIDYMTDQAHWLAVQRGNGPFDSNVLDSKTCHVRNGRDYAVYVHTDPNAGLLISFYNAAIWLFEQGAPLNPGNPYRRYTRQSSFATFGVPHFLGLLGEAKQRACKAAWYAKWYVHRTARPEAFGGLVHMTMTGQKKGGYPLDPDVLDSTAVAGVFSKYGTYFIPQAFPEGSPQHPSYPEGHSSMAGACATILKAAFDGSVQFNTLPYGKIQVANGDGQSLKYYLGSDRDQITVNGEIDKLASNIGLARDFAGIHWRSDSDAGLLLGEAAALSVLRDQSNNYAGEDFEGFTITKFDGTTVTV